MADLKTGKRIQTQYYGSFPAIFKEKVYFISDLHFVMTDDFRYKKITHFALYAYDPQRDKLQEVGRFDGVIEVVNTFQPFDE